MNSDFSLESKVENNVLVIATNGYINNHGGEKIAGEAYNHMGNGVNKIVLDLKNSKVVNSIGISLLIEIIEKLNQSNGKMVFVNLDPTIEKTFTIMGLFQFADKADTLDEAIK